PTGDGRTHRPDTTTPYRSSREVTHIPPRDLSHPPESGRPAAPAAPAGRRPRRTALWAAAGAVTLGFLVALEFTARHYGVAGAPPPPPHPPAAAPPGRRCGPPPVPSPSAPSSPWSSRPATTAWRAPSRTRCARRSFPRSRVVCCTPPWR